MYLNVYHSAAYVQILMGNTKWLLSYKDMK